MSDIESLELEVGPAEGMFEEGDTVEGVIAGAQVREENGGEYTYYDILIDHTDTNWEWKPGYSTNDGRITPQTGLGKLIQRFGYDLEELFEGTIDLADVFDPGQEVEFEVEMGDYKNKDDPDDDSRYVNVDRDTLRPAGEPEPDTGSDGATADSDGSGSQEAAADGSGEPEGDDAGGESESSDDGAGDGDDGGVEAEVIEYVEENCGGDDGDSDADVKAAMASKGGDYLTAYKDLKADGTLEVDEENETIVVA